MIFKDRKHAGHALAKMLAKKAGRNAIVVALPKGGIEVGIEVAKTLKLDFDFLCVKKIGLPFDSEIGIGAIAEGGATYENFVISRDLNVTPREFAEWKQATEYKLEVERKHLRAAYKKRDWTGKTIILVDDGLATGATANAAILQLKKENVKNIILAIPVAPPEVISHLKQEFRHVEIVCISMPINFMAVAQFYESFGQIEWEHALDMFEELDKKSKTAAAKKRKKSPAKRPDLV